MHLKASTLIRFSIHTFPISIITATLTFVVRWGGPSRPFPSTSVAGGARPTTSLTTTTGRVPPSPIGMGNRPSPPQPPFAPSSLSDRRSLASAEGASGSGGGGDESPSPKMQGLGLAQAQGPGKKRCSSSFSSVTGGSGSGVGSGGGTGREEGWETCCCWCEYLLLLFPWSGFLYSIDYAYLTLRGNDLLLLLLTIFICVIIYTTKQSAGGGSFLSTNADDDDISVFVQEIDARKPLSGHQRIRSLERETSEAGRRLGGSSSSRESRDKKPITGLLSTDEQETTVSTGSMLTSE